MLLNFTNINYKSTYANMNTIFIMFHFFYFFTDLKEKYVEKHIFFKKWILTFSNKIKPDWGTQNTYILFQR